MKILKKFFNIIFYLKYKSLEKKIKNLEEYVDILHKEYSSLKNQSKALEYLIKVPSKYKVGYENDKIKIISRSLQLAASDEYLLFLDYESKPDRLSKKQLTISNYSYKVLIKSKNIIVELTEEELTNIL